ncbi:MAG: DUF1289 domain-containing protein [Pseudomonadales bacterium]|nr:DUF1289 domain-containing protein [Pseudomonadales bacterium]
MSDEIVRSPCVNICFLEDDDICVGCYRHSDEITEWSEASNARRQAILLKCAERRAASGPSLS